MNKINDHDDGINFLKNTLSNTKEVLDFNKNQLIGNVLLNTLYKVNNIVNWKKICELNSVPKNKICEKEAFDYVKEKYIRFFLRDDYKNTINNIELFFPYLKNYGQIIKTIKPNENQLRLFYFIAFGQNIENYRNNEFSVKELLRAINMIDDLKLINTDVFDNIILRADIIESEAFIDYIYSSGKDNLEYIRNNTKVLHRLISVDK